MVTETWLDDGIRDNDICLLGYTLFHQDHPSRKKGWGVILYVKSNLLPQRVLLPPTTPSSLYVSLIGRELRFNTGPSVIALVCRSPNTPLTTYPLFLHSIPSSPVGLTVQC